MIRMDERTTQKIERGGASTMLPDGRAGVQVSFQYRSSIGQGDTNVRRLRLMDEFRRLETELQPYGVRLAMNSLSPSAQTVEGIVPLDRFDEVNQRMTEQGVRVDVVVTRQVV